ncbi:hypothetical protein [Ruegeria sp. HKCCA4812]|uniref:hypothetical protein n=1 Tax=Ruegeria sp. HKCCA4812 TaxID=2682993 RepID=UPI0014886C31|nr:hypothetical protein [Ruegeria sp. HKCCA4812]
MPLLTIHLDDRALGFAKEQAEQTELDNAEAYLTALLHGAINHEMKRDEEAANLPPLLPAIVIYGHAELIERGETQNDGMPVDEVDIPF